MLIKTFIILLFIWNCPCWFESQKTSCIGNSSHNCSSLWSQRFSEVKLPLIKIFVKTIVQKLFRVEFGFRNDFKKYTLGKDWTFQTRKLFRRIWKDGTHKKRRNYKNSQKISICMIFARNSLRWIISIYF